MTSGSVLPHPRAVAVALAAALLVIAAWQIMAERPAVSAGAATAGIVHITMTVTGPRTGQFKGDDGAGRAGAITVLAYQYELDASTAGTSGSGGGAGKVTHKPVTITHLLGGSSPEFLFAAATGEDLEVVIDFSKTDKAGKESVFYRVTLTDATVTQVKQYSSGDSVREDISFVFRKIEQKSLIANTDFIANVETGTA